MQPGTTSRIEINRFGGFENFLIGQFRRTSVPGSIQLIPAVIIVIIKGTVNVRPLPRGTSSSGRRPRSSPWNVRRMLPLLAGTDTLLLLHDVVVGEAHLWNFDVLLRECGKSSRKKSINFHPSLETQLFGRWRAAYLFVDQIQHPVLDLFHFIPCFVHVLLRQKKRKFWFRRRAEMNHLLRDFSSLANQLRGLISCLVQHSCHLLVIVISTVHSGVCSQTNR